MKTTFSYKIISIFLLSILVLSPMSTFALDIMGPDDLNTVDNSIAPQDDSRPMSSNYAGTINVSKLKNDPNGAGSLASCSQAVPAAQRAILGIQMAKANPVSSSVLETVFQNLPTLIAAGKQLGDYYAPASKAKDTLEGLKKEKEALEKEVVPKEGKTEYEEPVYKYEFEESSGFYVNKLQNPGAVKKFTSAADLQKDLDARKAALNESIKNQSEAIPKIIEDRKETNKKTWRSYANTALDIGSLGFASGAIAKKEQSRAAGDEGRLAELAEQETFRTECLDSVKIAIASNLLDRGTEEMISKIQTGNWGDPMYVQNGNDYLNNLKDQTILDVFGTDLSNRKAGRDLSNPYALGTIKSIIGSNQEQTFQERTKYTLGAKLLSIQNNYGQGTGAANAVPDAKASARAVKEFSNDFSKGGWEAWLSLTQNPANNPIGYGILAQEELAKKEAQQKEAIEAESNPQLLSTKVCTEYKDKNGKTVNKKNFSLNPNDKSVCDDYEITSPGSILTERMKWYVTSDVRRLELANKFNSSISEVMSAGINRLTKYGLDQLGQTVSLKWTATNSSPLAQYNTNMASFTAKANGNVVKYKNALYDLRIDLNSSYFKEDVNLERDLNDVQVGCVVKKGFVTTQQEYVDELKYMAYEDTSPLPKVMPYLSLLDMCIPGPTPAWQTYSDKDFASYIDAVSAQDPQKLTSPNLAFTKVNNLLNKRDKTAGTLNTIGSVATTVGSVVPPPYGSIVMAAGALTNISASIVKNRKVGGKDGIKPDLYRQAMSAFQEYVPLAIDEEAGRNKDRDIQKSIETYEGYVEYVGRVYAEENNLPVTAKANAKIGDLREKYKNIEDTKLAYNAEYEKSVKILNELKSIQTEVNSIYAEARANMQTEFEKTSPVSGAKWDDTPEVCRQVCAVVKKPETKQNFPLISELLKGRKLLDNGTWTTGYKPFDLTKVPAERLLENTEMLFAGDPSKYMVSGGTTGSGTTGTYTPPDTFEIISFTANNEDLNLGESAILNWEVEGADQVTITDELSKTVKLTTKNLKGSFTIKPNASRTYTLKIVKGTNYESSGVKITVID